MKFKYTGDLPIKDLDLALAGIVNPQAVINPGTVFEVPDDNQVLIQRVSLNGCYEPYIEPKKVGRPKKSKEDKEDK